MKAALPEVWPIFRKVLRKVRVRLLPAETDRCPAALSWGFLALSSLLADLIFLNNTHETTK